MKKVASVLSLCLLVSGVVRAEVLYYDEFDNDTLAVNASGIGGGAVNRTIEGHAWEDDGDAAFFVSGATDTHRAILYSQNTFQCDTGFRLTINYTTGSIDDLGAHNLSFGLIRSDTDLSTYTGFNPFQVDANVYSIGANVTADGGTAFRGLNFTDGSTGTNLDESGTRQQFAEGESTEVTIEVSYGGTWCYRINGEYEASGILLEGFDLSNSYHVVVYGQDDDGGGKSIQSIELKTGYALGERAAGLRGTWASVDHDAVAQVSDFKTLDTLYARFNDGSVLSGNHFVPHKLLERLALEGYDGTAAPITSVVPTWGDLSLDEPVTDIVHDQMLAIKAAGFKVKVYSNSEQFVGANTTEIDAFVVRWKEWCDNDPEAQAFIDSQPFHTKVWNSSTQQYDTAGPANRKYMFCYAEFVLKDFALRYGHLIDSWIWDSAADITSNGDKNNGFLADQRIFQAFANAVHAGNPEIPLAFNLGRSTGNYPSYPFQRPTHFDDFTFGHAFGGNNNHAAKPPEGNQFNLNYQHVTRMTNTAGYVHVGGNQDFDELVVGNFHSKLGPISWRYSNPPAWEQADFNQWNLEAMQAGGSMTWSGATSRGNTYSLWSEAYDILEALDDYLAENESPDTPNWARAYTILPDATIGLEYYHVLVEGEDFWDPENDDITNVVSIGNAPSWLTIEEDPADSTQWILSGIPTGNGATTFEFALEATETNGLSGSRDVELVVNEMPPVQANAVILAVADTNYGTDAVATMISSVKSYGAATFQIALDVVPKPGTSVRSGDGGGETTTNSWGIFSPGETGNHTQILNGQINEHVEGISNLRVTNFTANGSGLTPDHITALSFKSVEIADSQSTHDRVVVVANGVTNNPGGTKQATNPFIFDLEALAGSTLVSNVSLAIGSSAADQTKNKWAVNSIKVNYTVLPALGDNYSTWASEYGLIGNDALPGADVENGGIGDGYDNLAEFALGMNPTNSDAGSRESVATAVEGGTNWFEYVHYRRTDYAAQGLAYLLIDSTNLVDSVVSTNAQDQILVGPAVEGYEPVTNRYAVDEPAEFVELKIFEE